MVVLESDTQSEQEIKEALVAHGLTPEEPAKTDDSAKPVVDGKKSEPEGAPGEKIPAETKGEAAITTEVVEGKSQETPQETKPADEKKAKGGFQAKIDKLTAKAESLVEQLEEERGSKTALQKQLETVQAELEALKPAEVKTDEGPVRPKRPKLSDVDFDQEKFDVLEEKYDEELDAYYAAVTDKKTKEAVAGYEQSAAQAQEMATRRERIRISAKDIPDYNDVIAALPDESEKQIVIPPIVATYIDKKSEHPAELMYFLAKDYLDNEGEEIDRLSKLDDFEQAYEIRKIEERLVSERKSAKKPAKEAEPKPKAEPEVKAAPAAVAKPEAVPVKEQPKAEALEDDAPLTTVGTRATGRELNLGELSALAAGGDQAAAKLLTTRISELQAAKRAR